MLTTTRQLLPNNYVYTEPPEIVPQAERQIPPSEKKLLVRICRELSGQHLSQVPVRYRSSTGTELKSHFKKWGYRKLEEVIRELYPRVVLDEKDDHPHKIPGLVVRYQAETGEPSDSEDDDRSYFVPPENLPDVKDVFKWFRGDKPRVTLKATDVHLEERGDAGVDPHDVVRCSNCDNFLLFAAACCHCGLLYCATCQIRQSCIHVDCQEQLEGSLHFVTDSSAVEAVVELHRLLMAVPVRCPRNSRCLSGWYGPLRNLLIHLKSCERADRDDYEESSADRSYSLWEAIRKCKTQIREQTKRCPLPPTHGNIICEFEVHKDLHKIIGDAKAFLSRRGSGDAKKFAQVSEKVDESTQGDQVTSHEEYDAASYVRLKSEDGEYDEQPERVPSVPAAMDHHPMAYPYSSLIHDVVPYTNVPRMTPGAAEPSHSTLARGAVGRDFCPFRPVSHSDIGQIGDVGADTNVQELVDQINRRERFTWTLKSDDDVYLYNANGMLVAEVPRMLAEWRWERIAMSFSPEHGQGDFEETMPVRKGQNIVVFPHTATPGEWIAGWDGLDLKFFPLWCLQGDNYIAK